MRQHWRRFKAKLRPAQPRTNSDLVARMHNRLEALLAATNGSQRHLYAEQLGPAIQEQLQRVVLNPDGAEWFTLLVLRAPTAARAQRHMDKRPHSSHDEQARIFELIDFNDTFVSTVLALSDRDRENFLEMMRLEITWFCKRVGAPMFTEEQFEAITRGLTREIAVYLGAVGQGFAAAMTTRAQDAMGVDLVITDPSSGQSLNIDCKTPSSYRYRLQDLVREGRLSEADAERADVTGYAHEVNGHGEEAVSVVLLRIDPNEMGDIENFEFTRPELLGERLRLIFAQNYI